VIPSLSPDPTNEDACRRAAAQLQYDHRNWLVMWGCYTLTYIAFPLFPAPRGMILTASAPAEIAVKMRREERSAAGRVPVSSPPQNWQPPEDRQPPEDWRLRS
jgi:hypothetical protein